MIQVNNGKGEITLKMEGCDDTVFYTQHALISLLQGCNFDGTGCITNDMVYYTLELLKALLPNLEQHKRGLVNDARYLELPESLSTKQVQSIREALFLVENNVSIRDEKNAVFEALISLEA